MMPSQRTFVALDNLSRAQILALLPRLERRVGGIKIGLESYLAFGRDFVFEAKELFSGKIFLDLKLHDIPNTVTKAIGSLEGLPIDFLTVHASGGAAMLQAAAAAAQHSLKHATVLVVTVLTSLDDEDCRAIYGQGRRASFEQLALLLDTLPTLGVVCSAAELELLSGRETMVPGIRFEREIGQAQVHDQKSVFTPRQALDMGASNIVVGRSLTQAADLELALQELDR